MFKTNARALKSYFAYTYTDFKKTISIGIFVCLGAYLTQFLITLIVSLIEGGDSNSNSGMLMAGSACLLITFIVGVIVDTSNLHIKNIFRFPINRTTYAIGNLVSFLILPLAFISVVSLFYVLETVTYVIASSLIDNFVFFNTVTISNYLDGLLPTYTTVFYVLSLVYVIFMYFHRRKLLFAIILTVVIFAYIFLSGFRQAINRAFIYPFTLKSMLHFVLYTMGVGLGFHALAYIPLRLMEVKS